MHNSYEYFVRFASPANLVFYVLRWTSPIS